MGYIGPVQPYQYQEYHKRTLTAHTKYDPMPISTTEKVLLLTPFQRILHHKQYNNQQIVRKKSKGNTILSEKPIRLDGLDDKTKGRHFNEYV
ncbi:hypothetical protein J14TS2_45950 [Bacillus sp. J14TS2]|uniref:hypothetical protein n=1 Tax=Bacillus sp. J14TS2 TaxID=2807188 RepID=UPI001B0777CA|nr:hypothetical protein [Bacillus sp. J14TS2]GIN74120.1 hypothetical protein J14TS2_45950 [Bacillus sp. J14TS2]